VVSSAAGTEETEAMDREIESPPGYNRVVAFIGVFSDGFSRQKCPVQLLKGILDLQQVQREGYKNLCGTSRQHPLLCELSM
jgi:hypothetical protein